MSARALTGCAALLASIALAPAGWTQEPPPWFTGDWRKPGGSCMPAYLHLGAASKSRRGEAAVVGTVTKDGMVVTGNLVQVGGRRGQLVSDANDSAMFLLQERDGALHLIPISVNVQPWGETVLEQCP